MKRLKNIFNLLLCFVLLFASSASAVERVVYFHNDALGSPVAATDEQGQLLWTEAYEPYGKRLVNAASDNRLWYTGKPEESEFGLNYFGARWYDPAIGRFQGMDPVDFQGGNVQSFNRYAYANNNPYTYTDPDGRNPILAWEAIVAVGTRITLWMAERQAAAVVVAETGAAIATGAVTPGVAVEGAVANAGKAAANFATEAKLLGHFEKHGAEFGARTADEYLQVGRDIIQNGQKVEYAYKGESRIGYVQFMGTTSKGAAKFGMVGTNADGAITTIHTESGKSFWKLLNGNSADKTIRQVQ